jgi:hypothetical protein
MHCLIYIPGLNDRYPIQKRLTNLLPLYWGRLGIDVHIVPMYWENRETFSIKQKRILDLVDLLVKQGHKVSIVGQSAGGSAAGNVFITRKNTIHCFVNITGRLKVGTNVFPSLTFAARNSSAFTESVTLFEMNEPKLPAADKKRILTIRPFIDEVVPASTVPVPGATNLVAPFPEHILGGILIDIFYAGRIMDFLQQNNR